MVTSHRKSGRIQIIDNDEGSYTIILDRFYGSIDTDSSVTCIKFILYNYCYIENDIILQNHNKLDCILFEGKGSCVVQTISATSIEVRANIFAKHLNGHVVKIIGCKLVSDIDSSQPVPQIEDVDKTELEELIRYARELLEELKTSSIEGLDIESIYRWTTPEAKSNLENYLTYVESHLNDDNLTQEDVDDWIDVIHALIADLNPQWGRKADKDKLIQYINAVEEIINTCNISSLNGLDVSTVEYWITPAEFNSLQDPLTTGKRIRDIAYPTQEQVDEAAENLRIALLQVERKPGKLADKSALLEAINDANYALNNYRVSSINGYDIPRAASWIKEELAQALRNALPSAEHVYYEITYPSQAEVDAATNSLVQILDRLNPQPGKLADKSRLISDINSGQSELTRYKVSHNGEDIWYYDEWITPEAKNNLQEFLTEGIRIRNILYPSQELVDEAADNIEAAIASLSPQPGKKQFGPITNEIIDAIAAGTLGRLPKAESYGIKATRVDSILAGTATDLHSSEMGIPISVIDQIISEV